MSSSTTAPAVPPVVGRQRNVILATLLGLSAVGWIVFLVQAREPMDMEAGMGPDLTMGGSWPLFAGTWVAMMIAMMFPAAAPMVLLYARMRRHDPTSVVLFTAAYIALWFAFGVVAYLLSAGVESLASGSDRVAMRWGRVGGGLLVLAGLYQLTRLKDVCLRHCRSPFMFLMTHWRPGRAGALRMGVIHGGWCVGCCWALMAALFALGVMSIGWMAFIAALIAIEKLLPWKAVANRGIAILLAVLGLGVAFWPASVPGLTLPDSPEAMKAMQGMDGGSMGGGSMGGGSMGDESSNQGSMGGGSMNGNGMNDGPMKAGSNRGEGMGGDASMKGDGMSGSGR